MGLLGTVLQTLTGRPTASDRALLKTLCLATVLDGTTLAVERGYALGIAMELQGFLRSSESTLNTLMDTCLAELQEHNSLDRVVESIVSALETDEHREQAFTLAVVITRVDQRVDRKESEFLQRFQQGLGLSETRATSLLREVDLELAQWKQSDQAR